MLHLAEKNKFHNREFKELVNEIYEQEFSEENKFTKIVNNAKLIPSFQYDLKTHKLDIIFRENDDINSSKDLNEFYNNIQHRENIQSTDIIITIEGKFELYQSVLKKYVDIIRFINNGETEKKYLITKSHNEKTLVRLTALEEIMNYVVINDLKTFLNNEETRIFNYNLKLHYELKDNNEYCLFSLQEKLKDFNHIIYSKDKVYIIYKNIIYRCDKTFIGYELKVLEMFLKNLENTVILSREDLTIFFSLIMPKLQDRIQITDTELLEYMPENSTIKLFLDLNSKNYVIAEIKFQYQNIEFNPLLEEPKNIKRNILKALSSAVKAIDDINYAAAKGKRDSKAEAVLRAGKERAGKAAAEKPVKAFLSAWLSSQRYEFS